ncbi:MAG: hypothetical protein EA367_03120 [Leptolyngbya sp. DLM2.Bin15]|nr:MAG: hypothetical protein EA367_03120 [Leptolyngbya sp. DLM2.Bin15]
MKFLGSPWYGYGVDVLWDAAADAVGQAGGWVAIALDLATIRYLMVMNCGARRCDVPTILQRNLW